IFQKFKVRAVCTTDDPTDDLAYHRQIAESKIGTGVFPTFRPDRVLEIDLTEQFQGWVDKLARASDTDITKFGDLLAALKKRHDYFHELGCRLSDHGINNCYADFCDEMAAAAIFDKARAGK